MPKVGIVIVNYKNYVNRFLADCRDSLRLQTYPAENFQVYIVDNASSEESRAYIKDEYSEAIIIPREDGNYSAANNAGIKKAQDNGCKYFVIANMDTIFDKDWLAELVAAIDAKPDAGMVQSKILLEGKEKINSLGNVQHYLGFGYTLGYNELSTKQTSTEITEIKGYASGCSFITKDKVLQKIGLYNEEYYMYHDDLEMGWRARLTGYKIYLAPKSILQHKYEFSRSVRMLFYMERNRQIAMLSYYDWRTLILIFPGWLIMEWGMWFYALTKGWLKTKIKATAYFFKSNSWKKIATTRKQAKGLRKISEKKAIENLSGEVLFQEIENPLLKYVANPILNMYWHLIKLVIFW